MKVVIDSNRVIAALIKKGTTREILFDSSFQFFAPEHIKNEIEKHSEKIIKKAKIDVHSFNFLISIIFEHINVVPKQDYAHFIHQLKNEISDQNDLAYLAVCYLTKSEGIWSHDTHFLEQKKQKVFTNINMFAFMKKNNNH